MPKKKGHSKKPAYDFTINDAANAPKPVDRVKKSTTEKAIPELTWEQLADDNDEFDIIEEFTEDGVKSIVHRKKRNRCKSVDDNIDDRPGIVYPEIVWYLISNYIKPQEVGNFAGINKVTYSITKRESFWRTLYNCHCKNHPKLPHRLRIENSFKAYGLCQRVIRALYHTYTIFTRNVMTQASEERRPYNLVKRRCINVWYCKGPTHWLVFFKFKKPCAMHRLTDNNIGFIEELGRIDANPEEDSQVLQVTCLNFNQIPPLMGMTLSSLSMVLAQGFRHHRLNLCFNSTANISRDLLPELTVVLDTVLNMLVYDWWHPMYPDFDNQVPSNLIDEESVPMLRRDFLTHA